MATPRLWIIVVRGRRNILKYIRGYIAERDDSDFADTLTSASPPDALVFLGVRNIWGRGVKSAPIPALGGERLVRWGCWETVMPPATQTLLDAAEAQFPTLLRTFKQQGSYEPNGDFTPSETAPGFKARIMTAVGWIDDTP